MGREVTGDSLSWSECQEAAPVARLRAVEQLLYTWNRQKPRTDPDAIWGDELEYTLVDLDSKQCRATLLLDQQKVLRRWQEEVASGDSADTAAQQASLQAEFATYMVEATPGKPYGNGVADLLQVEQNMRQRRLLIRRYLGPGQDVIPICVFPRLGTAGRFTTPKCMPAGQGGSTPSPWSFGCSSSRYSILRGNANERRQRRAETHIPVFQDRNSHRPFYDSSNVILDPTTEPSMPYHLKENCVHLDGMDLGAGSCSLQVTIQSRDEPAARWLHDQLVPLGPVMLALTASTPVWKGLLVDIDSRWNLYSDTVDDRTNQETAHVRPRWDSNQVYISKDKPPGMESLSPLQPFDHDIEQQLLDGGMDQTLATHFAAIFSRDPLVLTRDDIDHYDKTDINILEKLQGFVWPSVRFKPPVTDDGPGWRVEFRPMEIQHSDFDNAAFAVFTYLVSRAISVLGLSFYVPIDQVSESMDRAQGRDAVLEDRLWFRRSGWLPGQDPRPDEEAVALMTLDEIINGEDGSKTAGFPGLISIVWSFLQCCDTTPAQQTALSAYLDRVAARAAGEAPTPARWMRNFITKHPDYRQDGFVHERICYDMVNEILRRNGSAKS